MKSLKAGAGVDKLGLWRVADDETGTLPPGAPAVDDIAGRKGRQL